MSTGGSNKTLQVGLNVNNQPAKHSLHELQTDLQAIQRQILNSGMQLSRAITGQTQVMEDAFRKVKSGTDGAAQSQGSLLTAILGSNVAMKAVSFGMEAMNAYTAATKAAVDQQKQFVGDLQRRVVLERELAFMSGKTANTQFDKETMAAAHAANMPTAEYIEFKKAVLGSGEGYITTDEHKGKVSRAQADKATVEAAQFASRTGLKSDTVGELLGALMAQRDYEAMGEKEGEEKLVGTLGKVSAILAVGRGSNPVLLNQITKVMASMVSSEEMKGLFKGGELQAAAYTSLMAESDPEMAFTMNKALKQVLYGHDPKEVGLRRRAGIDQGHDDLPTAVEKAAVFLTAEAKRQDVKPESLVSQYLSDSKTQDAIIVAMNRGFGKEGVIAQRMSVAEKVDADTMRDENAKALADPRSAANIRKTQLMKEKSEAGTAGEWDLFEQMFARTETQMRDRSQPGGAQLGTGEAGFKGAITDRLNTFNFGWLGYEEARIQEQMRKQIRGMDKDKAIISDEEMEDMGFNQGTLFGREKINKALAKLESAGINPLEGLPEAAKDMKEAAADLKAAAADRSKTKTTATPGGGVHQVAR